MTNTKINENQSDVLSSKSSYLGFAKFILLMTLSILITAFGQPDRGVIICSISYVFGYSSIFYLLLKFRLKVTRFVLAFVVMSFIQLHQLDWLATTTYHGSGIVLVYLMLVCMFASQFAVLSLFLPKKGNLSIARCAAMAAIWALFEVMRLYILCGFPFNTVGLVMSFHPYMMQMAALGGVFCLSFWVIFVSAIGSRVFKQGLGVLTVFWVTLLMLPLGFGYFHVKHHDAKSGSQKHMNIALIQTGLQVNQKWRFPNEEEKYIEPIDQWKNIFDLLVKTKQDSFDLIVLPEVALPGDAYFPDIDFETALDQIIVKNDRLPPLMEPLAEVDALGRMYVSHIWMAQAIANRFKSELIVGLLDRDDDLDESYNSAFHLVPFRNAIHRYEKRVLVPLAEYLPLPIMNSFLEKYGITEFFTPGKEAKVFTGEIPLSVSICYEEGYSNLAREARVLGAQLLVNVSNDAWFPKSRLPQEHFNSGVLRAVENGVPIVRACNTGITAVVDSLGRKHGELKDYDKRGEPIAGIVTASLGTYSYTTLFSLFGNNLIVLLSFLILIGFFCYKKTLHL